MNENSNPQCDNAKAKSYFARDWAPMHDVHVVAKDPFRLANDGGEAYTPDFLVTTEDDVALVTVTSEGAARDEAARRAVIGASRANPRIEFWFARQFGLSFDIEIFKGGKADPR